MSGDYKMASNRQEKDDYTHIYQQAAAWASRATVLLEGPEAGTVGVAEIRRSLETHQLRGAEHTTAAISTLRNASLAIAGRTSTISTLPALHQLLVEHYYDAERQTARVPLGAVKLAAAYAFAAGHRTGAPPAHPRQAFLDLLSITWLEYQLRAAMHGYAAGGIGDIFVAPHGISATNSLERTLRAQTLAYSRGGRIQRFANGTTEAMFARPIHFLTAVWLVLSGDPPRSVQAFDGSHLAEFPGADEAHAFWAALAARLSLLTLASDISHEAQSTGLALFVDSQHGVRGDALHGTTPDDVIAVNTAVRECFWRVGRYVAEGSAGLEFVDRPAMRAGASPDTFYVTSTLNIADSITSLTEKSVGFSRGAETAFPPIYFERLLSKPFEDRIIALFRDNGFIAGEVTAAGAWLTQDQVLRAPAVGRPAGQIDLLAWHPSGHVVLGDCKVLGFAHNPSAAMNQAAKLGSSDEERFLAKLRKNAGWAEKFLAALNLAPDELARMLILDRPFNLWSQPDDDSIVITEEDLSSGLVALLGTVAPGGQRSN